jgi:hypothetical protein
MSRSGYTDDCGESNTLNLYRGTVERIIRGKKGQAFLRELATALDAMPEKALIQGELVDGAGGVCAIGAICKSRGLDVGDVDYYDPPSVAAAVGISWQLAAEIEYENDEGGFRDLESPEQRWQRMRRWVEAKLLKST